MSGAGVMPTEVLAVAGFHPSFHARLNPDRPALILAATGERQFGEELQTLAGNAQYLRSARLELLQVNVTLRQSGGGSP